MSTPITLSASDCQGFDYSKLDAATSEFVQHQTKEIRTLIKRTAEDILEIGQRLLSVKEKLGYGFFLEWLESEFDGHRDTANKFMHVAREFGNLEMSKFSTFEISALYQLATPSTPQAARDEAIARATAGEPITYSIAKAIKQKYTPPRRTRTKSPVTPVTEIPISPATKLQPQPLETETQNQRIENFRPKQEILAIRPKQLVQESTVIEEAAVPVTNVLSTKHTSIKSGSWWQVAQRHLLFCGSPNSSRFQERLPNQVSLQLTFPPDRSNWQESISAKVKSALCLWSSYQDLELQLLRELVERALLLYTGGDEIVVLSFLPDPGLLLLAEQLGCRCLIAEPDLSQCQAAIAFWQTRKMRVEQVKTLRF